MQLKPYETFVIVRQLFDPYDAGTYYVQAKVRNAATDKLLATINLDDTGNQRFRKAYKVPADPTGEGFYIDIETIVYTDSGYTTVSENYGRENLEHLVQERQTPPFGAGGGPDIDYKRIGEIFRGVAKEAIPKPRARKSKAVDLAPMEKRLLSALEAVGATVKELDIPNYKNELKGVTDAIVEAKTAIIERVDSQPKFEKTDLDPIVRKMQEVGESVKSAVKITVSESTREVNKTFNNFFGPVRDSFNGLVKKFNNIPFYMFDPQKKKEDLVPLPEEERPTRRRKIPGIPEKTRGFISFAVVAFIGAVTLFGGITYYAVDTARNGVIDPTVGSTQRGVPQWVASNTPEAVFPRITDKNVGLWIKGSTQCLEVDSDGVISGTGSACSAGGGSSLHVDGGGFVYPQDGDYHSAPYYVSTSTATSTTRGGIEAYRQIASPYFHATGTAATSTFDGGLVVNGALNLNGANLLSNGSAYGIDNLSDAQNDLTDENLFLGHSGFSGTFYNDWNTAIGLLALDNANIDNGQWYYGDNNVAVGYNSLTDNTTGYQNIAVGVQSLRENTTGYDNVGVGQDALRNNTTGYQNIALGRNVMFWGTTGNRNAGVGAKALQFIETGSQNSALGYAALYNTTTGTLNMGIGAQALENNTTGSSNAAIGAYASFYNVSATNTTAIGHGAAQGTADFYAQRYTAVGRQALYNNTTGADDNVAIGYRAGYNNTTGSSNTFIGYQAGDNVTTGSNNIAIGAGVSMADPTASNQFNLGDIFYGDMLGLKTGVGSTTPGAKFSVTNNLARHSFVVEDSVSPDSTPFLIDQTGLVAIGGENPEAKLHVIDSAQSNAHYETSADMVLESGDTFFQLLANDGGNDAGVISLTNVPSSGDNKHWIIAHRGTTRNDNFEIGYKTSTSDGFIATGDYADLVITTDGNIGIGTSTPYAPLSVVGEVVGSHFTATNTAATSTFQDVVGSFFDKGGQVHNVKAYGAKGDGSTDDTAAFSAAIAEGGITFLPSGEYVVSGLTLTGGTHLRGVGAGHYGTTTASTTRSIIKLANSSDTDVITIPEGAPYGTIRDIEIDGNGASQSSGIGINVPDALTAGEFGWSIEDVQVYDTFGIGIYLGSNRQNAFLKNVIVDNSGQHGVQVNGSDMTLEKVLIGNSGWQNLVLGGYVNRFIGGDVWNAGLNGVVINGVHASIIGTGIDRNDEDGISVSSGAQDVVIDGVHFHSNGTTANNTYSDINVETDARVTISNNTFGALDSGYTNKRLYAINTNGYNDIQATNNLHAEGATGTGYVDVFHGFAPVNWATSTPVFAECFGIDGDCIVKNKPYTGGWQTRHEGYLFPDVVDNNNEVYTTIKNKNFDAVKAMWYEIDESEGGLLVERDSASYGSWGYNASNTAFIKDHAELWLVVTEGYSGFSALMASSTGQSYATSTLVSKVQSYGATGVSLDIEGFGSWTAGETSAYYDFVTSLCNELHAINAKCGLYVPPIWNTSANGESGSGDEWDSANSNGYYELDYPSVDALPLDYIEIPIYDYHFDYAAQRPDAPLKWGDDILSFAKDNFTDDSRIVAGFPSAGHCGQTNSYSPTALSFATANASSTFLATATRDPESGMLYWVDGAYHCYVSDSDSMDTFRERAERNGISNYSVWYIGAENQQSYNETGATKWYTHGLKTLIDGVVAIVSGATNFLGIGDTNPISIFHVQGSSSDTTFGNHPDTTTVSLQNSDSTDNNWFNIIFRASDDTAAAGIEVQHRDQSAHYADINLTTRGESGYSRVTIQDGNLGVGSTTPTYDLSVGADASTGTTSSAYYTLGNGFCIYEDKSTTTPNMTMGACP